MKVAVYLRLSKEDDNISSNANSESINNQKAYIEKYIQDNNLYITKIYIDDGYSGLNFERPGFQEMIKDIENKEIDTIITKDLSRLGRDYIQVGYYLERYFPEHGIRYIAINDNYDTNKTDNSNDFAPFKAVFNDMYAKDISKKVKTAFRTLQEEGKYLGASAPYGYDKDPNEKGKLIINKETSKVIKRIFELYLTGENSVCKIASILNQEGIISPARLIDSQSKTSKWNEVSIKRILSNEVYIGNIVQNKTNKLNYKTNKVVKVPKNEHIRVLDVHEPIIPKEDFNMVQAILDKKTSNRVWHGNKTKRLLAGFVYCGICGSKITFNREFMLCRGRKIKICNLSYYHVEKIEKIVIKTVQNICQDYFNEKIVNEIKKKKVEVTIKNKKENLNIIRNKITNMSSTKLMLYKDKLSGIISENDFVLLNNEISKELEEYEITIKKIEKELRDITENEQKQDVIENTIGNVIGNNEIDRNILALLIKKIYIYDEMKIKIEFTFEKPNTTAK